MTHAEQFFYAYAGYGYDPTTETRVQGRRRCARALAEAEQHARRMEWAAEWVWDDMPWEGEDTPSEVLGCILKNQRGDVLGSLWGIGDPSPEYRRVVEAELADEARKEIIASVMEGL